MLLCETSDVTPATHVSGGGGGGGDSGRAESEEGGGAAVDADDVVEKWKWPAAVDALIRRHKLVPELAQVPGQAPRTREQWEEWNTVWPIVWQKPNSHLSTPLEAPSEEDMAEMKRWMRRAISVAAKEKMKETVVAEKETFAVTGGVSSECGECNAVLIVDPASGEVISTGTDQTGGWRTCGYRRGYRGGLSGSGGGSSTGYTMGKQSGSGGGDGGHHPLRHAVFVAVDAASSRDLTLHPQETFEDEDQGAGERPHATTSNAKEKEEEEKKKKKIDKQEGLLDAATVATTHSSDTNRPEVGEKRRRDTLKGAGQTLTELTGRPYLCTVSTLQYCSANQ